jgi:hypothetical protein
MRKKQKLDIDFLENNVLLISLDMDDFRILKNGISYLRVKFRPKDEVHITIVGKALAKEISELAKRKPEIRSKIQKVIDETDWSYKKINKFYHVSKDKEKEDEEGKPRIVHAESIIQMVEVPQIGEFFEKLESILGHEIEIPPTHVTLYTVGDHRGIGIPDRTAFTRYVEREVRQDKLQNISNSKIENVFGNIHLIEKKSDNVPRDLKSRFSDKKICVCDFYVSGSEEGDIDEDGINHFDDLLIIDHHANKPLYQSDMTSTKIACRYVEKYGCLGSDYIILINHTDTDSILSAFIMNGKLEPLDEYVEAAEAADHTGIENLISDLLQSLEDDRSIEKSISLLRKVLLKRIKTRKILRQLAESDAPPKFNWLDGIAYVEIDETIDAGLAPPFLPNAKVILISSPMPEGSKGKWRIRARLGEQAENIDMNKLDLPDFGGRWNAGSTSRHGGTNYDLEEYVKILRERLNAT